MMAVHEFGHVVGAIVTGGTIERVVLHPLTISRTDVSPNPNPGVVVWLGPLIGCALPLLVSRSIPRRFANFHNAFQFFAGFCLIANGGYIAVGSLEGIGDCGEMLRTGTPLWSMIVFGVIAISIGQYHWHCLGSVARFVVDPSQVTPQMAYGTMVAFLVILGAEFAFSPL